MQKKKKNLQFIHIHMYIGIISFKKITKQFIHNLKIIKYIIWDKSKMNKSQVAIT